MHPPFCGMPPPRRKRAFPEGIGVAVYDGVLQLVLRLAGSAHAAQLSEDVVLEHLLVLVVSSWSARDAIAALCRANSHPMS